MKAKIGVNVRAIPALEYHLQTSHAIYSCWSLLKIAYRAAIIAQRKRRKHVRRDRRRSRNASRQSWFFAAAVSAIKFRPYSRRQSSTLAISISLPMKRSITRERNFLRSYSQCEMRRGRGENANHALFGRFCTSEAYLQTCLANQHI